MSMAATYSFLVSTPSLKTPHFNFFTQKQESINPHLQQQGVCNVSKRSLLSLCLTSILLFSAGSRDGAANAAIVEADDDLELLEKVKKDRLKRIDRQLLIDSHKKETAYLQDVVYKLSQAGEAIEKEDMVAASSVLGSSADAEWVQKANQAFTKLSSSPEEKTEVETFNSSVAKLIASGQIMHIHPSRFHGMIYIQTSKQAFVASATALEKWVSLARLASQIKGI